MAANGTPWPWPWFPGAAFGVIAGAVGLRSYALTMTFGLDGDIWKKLPTGRAIVFDTIWRPYFLLPLAFAACAVNAQTPDASSGPSDYWVYISATPKDKPSGIHLYRMNSATGEVVSADSF